MFDSFIVVVVIIPRLMCTDRSKFEQEELFIFGRIPVNIFIFTERFNVHGYNGSGYLSVLLLYLAFVTFFMLFHGYHKPFIS